MSCILKADYNNTLQLKCKLKCSKKNPATHQKQLKKEQNNNNNNNTLQLKCKLKCSKKNPATHQKQLKKEQKAKMQVCKVRAIVQD